MRNLSDDQVKELAAFWDMSEEEARKYAVLIAVEGDMLGEPFAPTSIGQAFSDTRRRTIVYVDEEGRVRRRPLTRQEDYEEMLQGTERQMTLPASSEVALMEIREQLAKKSGSFTLSTAAYQQLANVLVGTGKEEK